MLDERGLRVRFEFQSHVALKDAPQTARYDATSLQRMNDLWRSTCFEVFWGPTENTAYYELNLAAGGRWNLYHFVDERTPQPPSESRAFELVTLATTEHSVEAILHASTAMSGRWRASINAVIRTADDQVFYFATHHAGPRPDFHHPGGRTLILDANRKDTP